MRVSSTISIRSLALALLLGALASGCGTPANEFPTTHRGAFEMTRLMGTDNVTLTVGANSIAMGGCDVNCPDPTITFDTITCNSDGNCTVANADCTGNVELWTVGGRSLEITLTAVPGATGEAATNRQVNCFQYSGSTSTIQ